MNSIVNSNPLVSASASQQLAYALPAVATTFVIGSLAIVQGIYAKYFGLSLATIATVIFISRIFDAVTDPLIGYYSDQYQTRHGSRKPFVIVGAVLFVISSYFLYSPVDLDSLKTLESDPSQTSISVSAGYFLACFLAFYFSWTLFEIPHLSWGAELARTSQEKTKVYSLRAAAGWCGVLLFYLVPLLPFFETQAFTPQTLYWAVIGTGFIMLPLLYLCIKKTPNGIGASIATSCDGDREAKSNWKALVKEVIANRPLCLFLLVIILYNISATGMWMTLLFIYADAYLALGQRFAQASIIGLVIGLPMIGVLYGLASRWGKKVTLSLGVLLNMLGIIGTGFLSPGDSSFYLLSLFIIFCYGMGGPAFNCLAPSLLADIIDYGNWKFGHNRSASYFSLYSLAAKSSGAIGGAAGLAIAGYYGFDPAAVTQSEEGIFGIKLAIAGLPAVIILMAVILIILHPMTATRHEIIRRRLDARVICESSRDKKAVESNSSLRALNIMSS